jgi:hypothetical protein
MMTVSLIPIWSVDVVGSILMIVFAFLSFGLCLRLKKKDPNNIIVTYLWWVCFALFVFAISRSAGHLLKQIFLLSHRQDLWTAIRPFSGAIKHLYLCHGGIGHPLFRTHMGDLRHDFERPPGTSECPRRAALPQPEPGAAGGKAHRGVGHFGAEVPTDLRSVQRYDSGDAQKWADRQPEPSGQADGGTERPW